MIWTTGVVILFALLAIFSSEKLVEAKKELVIRMKQIEDWARIAADSVAETDRWAELHRLDTIHRREELKDAKKQHVQIEAQLREQVQDLAEKLSTLALQGATPVVHKFEKKPEPPTPYAPALQAFFDAIDFPQARELVEEDIERLRAQGKDDELILSLISEALDD